MKKEDAYGIGGGLVCFFVAYYDTGWRLFWVLAGGALVIWCLGSVVGSRFKK